MTTTMRGVFAVSTTPFGAEGEQRLDLLTPGLTRALDAGVDGILTMGATGEALALTTAEREDQIRATVETVDGRVPVVVGCMAYRPEDMLDLIAQAAAAGAQAAMITPPFYGGLAPEVAAEALDRVLERSELPVMVYNNPGATGVDLLPSHLAQLRGREAFWSVKETSGAATRVAELRQELGEDVEIFVGADGIALEGFAQGASGWVAASAYLAPASCARLWRLADAGDWNGAVELWRSFGIPLGQIEGSPAFISLIKQGLSALGLEQGPVRSPLPTADHDSVAEVVSAVTALEQEVGSDD
ncbi:dihydrodipicolinate synthase family protein [Ornithinimicrobium panacihumi]|uniref:dihydrodipicolinate synthase family protein n=1 Tax=Ornithinimicrobium panacihumi TaxID=2008449 RepID=UPI003F8C6286